ncbi:molybdopterin biosynthesis-like protein MoeZ [compost metagenome]
MPANLTCGVVNSTVPEISVHKLHENLGKIRVIDVRRPDEFNNELGHIPGAELVTLGPDLVQFLEKGDRGEEMVFVCRSGARSEQATIESLKQGFKKTVNMVGGMIQWNEAKLTTVRT